MSQYGDVEQGTPLAANGQRQVLLTQAGAPFSGAAGTTVLPASGAWTASKVMPADKQRRLVLELGYNASASTTTGAAEVLVLLSRQKFKPDSDGNVSGDGVPLYTDDVWYFPLVANPTIATGALAAGTLAASSTFTRTQTFYKVTYGPLAIELAPVTANSDIARVEIEVDATSAFWWYLQAREIGDTTNRGILNISWSLAV